MATLIDTSILVYAAGIDKSRGRQQTALLALRVCRAEGSLPVQVLAESLRMFSFASIGLSEQYEAT